MITITSIEELRVTVSTDVLEGIEEQAAIDIAQGTICDGRDSNQWAYDDVDRSGYNSVTVIFVRNWSKTTRCQP